MNRTLITGLTVALSLGAANLSAQTARLQVIHNSADLAASVVDVYVNGGIFINDFAFRTAEGFQDVPAGVDLTVGIALANSTSANDTIPGLGATYNLPAGGTFVLIANGIVLAPGYNPVQPFDLYAVAGAETSGAGTTGVAVFHGATDAPAVDVFESAVLNVNAVSSLSYGQFTGYLTLPTNDYILEVRAAGDPNTIVAYSAPLQTLGADGISLVVLASGFLDPSQNNGGEPFGLFAALPSGGPLLALPVYTPPTARLQVIHNSADAAASVVDVYVNGGLYIDDFLFRTAEGFQDVPAGVDLRIGIAPSTSINANDTIAGLGATYNLADGGTYVLVANGIVLAAGYNPVQPFELYATGGAETSAAGTTGVLVFHGATDAPAVDVFESAVLGANAVSNLSYGNYAGYLTLPTDDYVLEVRAAGDPNTLVAYSAPLATLGADGISLVVVASGFLNPAQNNNGPGFGLYAALPGGGDLLALPVIGGNTARLQVIHNSADNAAAVVDVYVNGGMFIDDFAFRTAEGFQDVPAGVDLQVGIALGNSTSAADTIPGLGATYNLAAGVSYILIANGIVLAPGYNPVQPFELYPYGNARETATSGASNTDILVFHGATDAPIVDVGEIGVLGGATVVDDLAYGEFDGYLEVPTNDYVLEVRLSDGTPVVAYQAPLSTLNLDGAALTVVASGFLNPANNNNGEAFGLWVALASGGDLIELPLFTSVVENDLISGVAAWPNPANDQLFLSIESKRVAQAELRLTDLTGRVVRTLPATSLAAGNNRLVFDLNGVSSGMYQLTIAGEGSLNTIPVQVVR
jgi:hypothetical protein